MPRTACAGGQGRGWRGHRGVDLTRIFRREHEALRAESIRTKRPHVEAAVVRDRIELIIEDNACMTSVSRFVEQYGIRHVTQFFADVAVELRKNLVPPLLEYGDGVVMLNPGGPNDSTAIGAGVCSRIWQSHG